MQKHKITIVVSDQDLETYLLHFRKFMTADQYALLNDSNLIISRIIPLTDEEITSINVEGIEPPFNTMEDVYKAFKQPFDKGQYAMIPERFTRILKSLNPNIVTNPEIMTKLKEITDKAMKLWCNEEIDVN